MVTNPWIKSPIPASGQFIVLDKVYCGDEWRIGDGHDWQTNIYKPNYEHLYEFRLEAYQHLTLHGQRVI